KDVIASKARKAHAPHIAGPGGEARHHDLVRVIDGDLRDQRSIGRAPARADGQERASRRRVFRQESVPGLDTGNGTAAEIAGPREKAASDDIAAGVGLDGGPVGYG